LALSRETETNLSLPSAEMKSIDDTVMVAPSPTPFGEDDQVDHAAIEHNVNLWLNTRLSGFVLNSENGEEAFLSESEKVQIIRTVKSVCGGDKLIVAGVDSPSVTETLRIGEAMVDAGADMLRIRIPRLTNSVEQYFREVIARSSVPILIIHQMAPGSFLGRATSVGASAELLADLCAEDNVFGYIASDNLRFEARVSELLGGVTQFWASNGSLLLPAATLGANGGCMMLANVAPANCLDVLQHVAAGEWQQAVALHSRIVEADWQILSRGAAGVKAALELLGFRCGPPRSPSPRCDQADIEQIRQAMIAAGWLTGD
jgi:dihydrodipicolinate synthase/N-acetylneuraminate lyase